MRTIRLLILMALGCTAAAQGTDRGKAAAIRVIEAIYAGNPVEDVEGGPTLRDIELSELAALAGCEPSNEKHQKALVPVFDWNCPGKPSISRTTTFYISDQVVDDILVQPVATDFRPTEAALNAHDLPSRKALSSRFLKAVREDDDPTLSGLIPITEIQRFRLKVAEGTKATEMSGSTRYSHVYLWKDSVSTQGKPLITDLRFDKEGRPIGLVLSHGMVVR